MAFITLAGTLRDPTSELAVGDQIRFTHKSTTGETVEGAVSVLTIDPSGTYSKDLQYGLVLVEYKDVRTSQFKNLGVATVNGSNPATSIPELLNALVPVSSAELIEFQAILADATTQANNSAISAASALVSRNEAEAFAASIGLINDLSQSYIFGTVAEYKASSIAFPVGKTIHLNDRDADFTVIAGTGAANAFNVIASTGTGQSISMARQSHMDVINFGAAFIGTDSAAATRAAIAYCITNKVTLSASGDFDYYSTVDFRQCNVDFSLANIAIHHTGIGVTVGGSSNDPSNPYQTIKQIVRTVGVATYNTPDMRVIGARGQHLEVGYCNYIQLYASTDTVYGGTASSIAYNTFRFQNVDILELTTQNDTDGSAVQWINENKFTMSSCRVLLINGTYAHNHNIFTGGTFESATAKIEMQVGRSNYVRDIRNEGILNVIFSIGVQDCAITLTMTNSGHQYNNDAATIVSNQGDMCTVQHEYDTLAPLQTVLGITYQTLKKVGLDYNVQGIKDLDIGIQDLSAPIGTEIYRSQLIPAYSGNGFFEIDALESVPAGGFRVQVTGFDVNRDIVPPAPDQVNYAGSQNRQFDEDDTGINTNNSSRFYIVDGSCRFIEISISVAGAGLSCKGLYVGARWADIQQRKAGMAAIHTTNNFI